MVGEMNVLLIRVWFADQGMINEYVADQSMINECVAIRAWLTNVLHECYVTDFDKVDGCFGIVHDCFAD